MENHCRVNPASHFLAFVIGRVVFQVKKAKKDKVFRSQELGEVLDKWYWLGINEFKTVSFDAVLAILVELVVHQNLASTTRFANDDAR